MSIVLVTLIFCFNNYFYLAEMLMNFIYLDRAF